MPASARAISSGPGPTFGSRMEVSSSRPRTWSEALAITAWNPLPFNASTSGASCTARRWAWWMSPWSKAVARSRIGPEAAWAITEMMPTAPTDRNGRNRPSSPEYQSSPVSMRLRTAPAMSPVASLTAVTWSSSASRR